MNKQVIGTDDDEYEDKVGQTKSKKSKAKHRKKKKSVTFSQ